MHNYHSVHFSTIIPNSEYGNVIPEIAESSLHSEVQCVLTQQHVCLRQTAVEGNMWLGSDQDLTPSGKTGATNEIRG